MAVGKGGTLAHKPVEIGRIHVCKTQLSDSVVTLLVSDDQDDVRA
jgi:hypothetical protein